MPSKICGSVSSGGKVGHTKSEVGLSTSVLSWVVAVAMSVEVMGEVCCTISGSFVGTVGHLQTWSGSSVSVSLLVSRVVTAISSKI